MLELKDINFKRDGKQILNNINLKLDTKKFIAITGPNGSGKSTLAKIIMGIEMPDYKIINYRKSKIRNRVCFPTTC